MKVEIEVPSPERPLSVREVRERFSLGPEWHAVFMTQDGQVVGFPSLKRRPRENEVMTFVFRG